MVNPGTTATACYPPRGHHLVSRLESFSNEAFPITSSFTIVSPLVDCRVRGLVWLWCGIYSLLSYHGLFYLINCILRSPCPSLGLIYWIVVTVTDIAQSSLRFVRDLRSSRFTRVPVLVLRGNIVHSPPITRSGLNTVGSCSFVRESLFELGVCVHPWPRVIGSSYAFF